MVVAPFRQIIRSPADGATGLLLQEGYAGHAVGVDGAGSASWPSCRLAFCCGRGSSFRLSCVACLFWVLGAAGDRGFAFRSMVCRPSGRIVFFLFLLPVWLLGGLLCVAVSADWSAEARGGKGQSHNGDVDGCVHFLRISCSLSKFGVRSSLWGEVEGGLGLRFEFQRPDGHRQLVWRRKMNSIVSRGLVVIFISFRVFPARKYCTVLSLLLI